MKKSLFLILAILISLQSALASNENVGPIIQRQSKQIQELKDKLQELEKSLTELKLDLKNNGLLVKKTAGAPIAALSSVVGEEAAGAILDQNDSNSFFDKTEQTTKVSKEKSEKSEYELALATLKDGRFEEAESQFSNFIENYPSSSLQSNATFWYAETFYRREMFNKAAVNYLQSYKHYPKGSKAADSLLKLSYSLASLNKKKEACSMLLKLEQEFPERPIDSVKRTREAKNQFQCK
jgi:tol-pal system protein YbgF